MSIVTAGFSILTYLYKDDMILSVTVGLGRTFFFLNLYKDHAIKILSGKYPLPVEVSVLCFSLPKIIAIIGENERFSEPQLTSIPVKGSRYRPGVAQRVGRGIALLFHDLGTRRG